MNILGFHVICTNYGFWLPNDERGSGSDFVRADHLTKFGPANPVSHGHSVAYSPHDVALRRLAKSELKYPEVILNGAQALSCAKGIRHEIETYGGTIWSYARMPDHEHFVIAQHRYEVRRFIGRLRGAAKKQLKADQLHPLQNYRMKDDEVPSPWARLSWIVYLISEEDIWRAIEYVKQNPVKKGLPRQDWSFVFPYPARNPRDLSPY